MKSARGAFLSPTEKRFNSRCNVHPSLSHTAGSFNRRSFNVNNHWSRQDHGFERVADVRPRPSYRGASVL